jgi:hypothetical protein
MYLTQLYNQIFPSLLHKSLGFYIWFYVEKEPDDIFSKGDILEIIGILNERDIEGLDELIIEIHSFPIADAVVVREAMRYRIDKLEGREDKHIIARNKAVDAVIECLQTFCNAMP